MGDKVKGQVSEGDINSVRASLVIPLIITIFCSALDMLFQIKNEMVLSNTFKECLFWILGTLISYFFPSFLAASITLLRQYYFAKNLSGVSEGKGLLLLISTIIFFFLYIVYLLFADTYYIVIFALVNVVYALFVVNKCMDKKILVGISPAPKGKVANSPN